MGRESRREHQQRWRHRGGASRMALRQHQRLPLQGDAGQHPHQTPRCGSQLAKRAEKRTPAETTNPLRRRKHLRRVLRKRPRE
jgi:hypothetical protein